MPHKIPAESPISLVNGAIVTGSGGADTQLFFQNDKPTAEVANAMWLETTTDREWIWNGSDWVSATVFQTRNSALVTPGSLVISNGYPLFNNLAMVTVPVPSGTRVLLENITAYLQGVPVFSGTLNGSNYLTPALSSEMGNISLASLNSLSLLSPITPYVLLNTPTMHTMSLTAAAGTTLGSRITHNVTGTPSVSWTPAFNWTVLTQFREIHP